MECREHFYFLDRNGSLANDPRIRKTPSAPPAVADRVHAEHAGISPLMLRFIVAMGTVTAGQVEDVVTHAHAGPSTHTVAAAHPLPRYRPPEDPFAQIDALGSKVPVIRDDAQKKLMQKEISYDEFVRVGRMRHEKDADTCKRAKDIFDLHQPRFQETIDVYARQLEAKIMPNTGNVMPWIDGIPAAFVFPEYFRPCPGGEAGKVAQMYVSKGCKDMIPIDNDTYGNYVLYSEMMRKDLALSMASHFLGRDDLAQTEIVRFREMLDEAAKNNDTYSMTHGKMFRMRWRFDPPAHEQKKAPPAERSKGRMSRNDVKTAPFDVIGDSRGQLTDFMEPLVTERDYHRRQLHRE